MDQANLVELLDAKHPEAGEQEITDRDAAFELLKTASTIKPNMVHFKEQWKTLRPKRFKDREVRDREMLKGLAALLADGKIVIKSKDRQASGGSDEDDGPAPAPAQRPRKRMITGSGMKIRERPDPAPPAPPPPPIDVAQQVEALLQAAKSGAPFVEQCEKSS